MSDESRGIEKALGGALGVLLTTREAAAPEGRVSGG